MNRVVEKLQEKLARLVASKRLTRLDDLFDEVPSFVWEPFYQTSDQSGQYEQSSPRDQMAAPSKTRTDSNPSKVADPARKLSAHNVTAARWSTPIPLHLQPVLQLVKSVCFVLALDRSVASPVD